MAPQAAVDFVLTGVGLMYLGIYYLNIPAAQRSSQPYQGWFIVSIEMIVTYAICWIWWILDFFLAGDLDNFEWTYVVFMFVMNLV